MRYRIDLGSMDYVTLKEFLSTVRGLMEKDAWVYVVITDTPYVRTDEVVEVGITDEMAWELLQVPTGNASRERLLSILREEDGFVPED